MSISRTRVGLGLIASLILSFAPGARAGGTPCDRQDISGLAIYSDFSADSCALARALTQLWVARRAEVRSINALVDRRVRATDSGTSTNFFMEINLQMIRLQSEIRDDVRALFGTNGHVTLALADDPRARVERVVEGFDLRYEREWRDGTWPFTARSGVFQITAQVREESVPDRVRVCINDDCRELYDDGSVPITRESRAR